MFQKVVSSCRIQGTMYIIPDLQGQFVEFRTLGTLAALKL